MSPQSYPPSPAAVPRGFTAPSRWYRVRVTLALFAIVLFVALYFGLIIAALWLLHVIGTDAMGGLRPGHVGAGVVLLMFVAFMVNNLFKRERRDLSRLIEVTREGEPALFAFLDRLTAETGAALPERVYLSAEINAGLFSDTSFASLFRPVRKNLRIGLGLVGALNASELKAVLAHELGHLAGPGMKLGSYVHTAHSVLHDMIWAPDRWDRMLAAWRRRGGGVARVAWMLAVGLWLSRFVLGRLLRAGVRVDAALLRSMELHADRVAVSVTGSDALCHAIYRLDFAQSCMHRTLAELKDAGERGRLYTDDLFYHLERTAEFMRRISGDPDLGVPPPTPADDPQSARLFERDEKFTASMWASHPAPHEREDSAKAVYIPCAMDERPAWVLFGDPARVRGEMTASIMKRRYGEDVVLWPAEEVQAYIDRERAEYTYDPRYRGMYDGRRLVPGDVEEVLARARAAPMSASELADAHAELYGGELSWRMARIRELRAELDELSGQGRGAGLSEEMAEERSADVVEELNELYTWLCGLDARVLEVHAHMAAGLEGGLLDELGERYAFHLALQEVQQDVEKSWLAFEGELAGLLGGGPLDESEHESVWEACQAAYDGLEEAYEQACSLTVPGLENMEPGSSLEGLLFPEGPVDDSSLLARQLGKTLLHTLAGEYEELLYRLMRLYFKSMGGILALQERISEEWPRAQSSRALR